MIAQIKSGAQFAGLVNYANDTKKKGTNILAYSGVSVSSNASISASFTAQAKSNSRVKNFVGHISLSFSPNDKPKLTDELMTKIALEYLLRMGIRDTQYVVFQHHDQPHPHVHIVYNRVDNNGRTIKGDSNFRKSVAVTKALTREYGLTFGNGKRDVRRGRLKGKDAVKYRLYDAISASLANCRDWKDLHDDLSTKNIQMEFFRGKEGRIRGVTFTSGNVTFSGSKIDHSLSFGSINRIFLNRRFVEREENIPMSGYSPMIRTDYKDDTSNNTSMLEDILGAMKPSNCCASSVGSGGSNTSLNDEEKKKRKKKFKR